MSEDDILWSIDWARMLCLLTSLLDGLICFMRPKTAEFVLT